MGLAWCAFIGHQWTPWQVRYMRVAAGRPIRRWQRQCERCPRMQSRAA